MEDMIIRLQESGVDVECVITKLAGNEALYTSICKKFLLDTNYLQYQNDLKENVSEAAITHIHTLKGVAGNLGFINMERICGQILAKLRNHGISGLDHYNKELSEDYNRIISIISIH